MLQRPCPCTDALRGVTAFAEVFNLRSLEAEQSQTCRNCIVWQVLRSVGPSLCLRGRTRQVTILVYNIYSIFTPFNMPRSAPSATTRRQQPERKGRHSVRQDLLPAIKRTELYRDACTWLHTPQGRKENGDPNYLAAHSRPESTGIKYGTLRNRYKKLHKAPHEAHESQMLIPLVQEDALVEWMVKAAREGQIRDLDTYIHSYLRIY